MNEWISLEEYKEFYENKGYEIVDWVELGEAQIYVRIRKEEKDVQSEDKRGFGEEAVLA